MRHETTRRGQRRPSARRARAAIIIVIGLVLSATIAAPVGAGSPAHDGLAGARTRAFHDHDAGRPVRVDARKAAREAALGTARKTRPLGRFRVPFAPGPATTPTKPASRDLANPASPGGRSSVAPKIVVPQPAPVITASFPGLTAPRPAAASRPTRGSR
jgi:hypothetical protein